MPLLLLCINNILGENVKGHSVSHVKQQGRRDFHRKGEAQMEALRRNTPSKGRRRVSPHWIHSVMPAQRQTFFHRVLHEMYPNPHYAHSEGIVL